MLRSMSRVVDGQTVQMAGGAGLTMSDEEARERCSGAPPHIRQLIDRRRESRGLCRLWARDGKTAAEPGGEPAAEANRKPLPDRVMLVGVVAPGLSAVPVRVATDGELLREKITPDAYRHFLRGVTNGTSVVRLTDGHGGDTLADTRAGSLLLAVDDVAGLVIQAVVPVMSLHRDVLAAAFQGEAGLSIGLRPVRVEMKRMQGERIRLIREVAVDHVAVIRPHQGEPCYRTKLFAAFTTDDKGLKCARAKAVIHALEGIRDQQRGA